jgi:hypothetical protein
MRGSDERTGELLSYVDLEKRVPAKHPLRLVRRQGLRRGGVRCRHARAQVTPHIAQNVSGRRSAIDARTTRHPGYVVSQQKRKRIEEPFG